jgi:hypothetical protein
MYYYGFDVALDFAEALRLYQLAAAQGHPAALFWVTEQEEEIWRVNKTPNRWTRHYRAALNKK